jgi:hypothetical protein
MSANRKLRILRFEQLSNLRHCLQPLGLQLLARGPHRMLTNVRLSYSLQLLLWFYMLNNRLCM